MSMINIHHLPVSVKGVTIQKCKPTGGKAGKGHNKTSTIQVMDNGNNTIIKQYRYNVNDRFSAKDAVTKANQFAWGFRK